MTFLTISDVHIKEEGDLSESLLLDFLKLASDQNVKKVYLLGDIFDLLVGGHILYQESYPRIFKEIEKLLKNGVEVIQLEGNHDFHFQKLIKKLCKKWNVSDKSWRYHTEPLLENYGDQRILFAHGDEIELGNESYKKYRRFIRSGFIHFLANYVVSPRITRAIGQNASKKSRKRNVDRYSVEYEEEKVRPLFRKSAEQASRDFEADIIICGHSHCYDEFLQEDFEYYNNGFLPRTKTCFYFNGERISPMPLNTSK